MIECRDLALNHPLTVGGSWDSFEPNGTGLTSPALFAKLYSATTSLCQGLPVIVVVAKGEK